MDSSGWALAGLGLAAVAGVLWLLVRRARDRGEARLDRILSETAAARQASESIDRRFDEMRRAVEERVGGVERRLNEGQTQVSTHLGEVREKMGHVFEASQKIERLATDMTRLEELLRPPKMRGALGEMFLEQALAQVIPARFWKTQYRFRDGGVVDVVVFISRDRCVPIDSKFPLENYRRLRDATEENDRRRARRDLAGDVRRHVDSIQKKYIRPSEGTTDFALMYLPAEAVYCELTTGGEDASLMEYSMERRVIPVSPTLLYAHLAIAVTGIRGVELQESAQEIQARLSELGRHWERLEEPFGKLGTHLANAQKQYEESSKAFERFAGRLSGIAESGQRSLEEERDEPRLPPPS